jgi:hypothetical protein
MSKSSMLVRTASSQSTWASLGLAGGNYLVGNLVLKLKLNALKVDFLRHASSFPVRGEWQASAHRVVIAAASSLA